MKRRRAHRGRPGQVKQERGAGQAPEDTGGAALCESGVLGEWNWTPVKGGREGSPLWRQHGQQGGGGGMLASLNGLRRKPSCPALRPPAAPPSHCGHDSWPCLQRSNPRKQRHAQSRFPPAPGALWALPILGQPLLQGPAQRSPEHAASLPTRRLFPGLGEMRRGGWPSRPPTPIPSPCSSRAPHCISPTPTTLLLRTQRGPRRASTASCHGLLGRVYKHLVKSVRILQSKS